MSGAEAYSSRSPRPSRPVTRSRPRPSSL